MFDDENLYLLSRWNDATPLNNPGLCGSDAGFAGDCLQVRLILDSTGAAKRDRQPTERCCHVDAWRGRDGRGKEKNGGEERLRKLHGGSSGMPGRRLILLLPPARRNRGLLAGGEDADAEEAERHRPDRALRRRYADEPLLADVGEGAACVAADAEGTVYVGYGEPFNAVRAFDREGRVLRTVGKEGGRALVGPWDREGMRFVTALAVDARGALWAAEFDDKPRRFSRWDAKGGGLEKEFFGPTHYGAGGGAICPVDPYTVCGLNCEWKIDPATGRSECVAVVTRGHWANARFGQSPDGRVYLVVGGGWGGPFRPSEIYERLAPGRWALRTRLTPKQEGWNVVGCTVWSDRNGDEREQADEVRAYDIDLGGWIDGWYMPCNQNLGFGGGAYYVRVTGWTPCGAPEYDLSKAVRLPEAAVEDGRNRGGMGAQRNIVSEDGRYVIYNGHYGAHHSDMPCYDVATGRRVFAYPNTYVGVHGGHSAPPARQGLVRAAYDFVGTLKLPGAAGNLFFVGTDKGEWHVLNDRGFYVGALFEGDPMKVRWPEAAVPGANLNRIPPGMGAEDFGGSVIRTTDGKVYLQAGKTAFIDIRLDGLDTIRDLASGTIEFSDADVVRAGEFQAGYLAAVDSGKRCAFPLREVAFTGDPAKDFDGVEGVSFGPDGAHVRAWAALGAERLRLAWDVQDRTPWKNGARGAANMYATGDTVDFQLGVDASADPRRADPVKGDFRLSRATSAYPSARWAGRRRPSSTGRSRTRSAR